MRDNRIADHPHRTLVHVHPGLAWPEMSEPSGPLPTPRAGEGAAAPPQEGPGETRSVTLEYPVVSGVVHPFNYEGDRARNSQAVIYINGFGPTRFGLFIYPEMCGGHPIPQQPPPQLFQVLSSSEWVDIYMRIKPLAQKYVSPGWWLGGCIMAYLCAFVAMSLLPDLRLYVLGIVTLGCLYAALWLLFVRNGKHDKDMLELCAELDRQYGHQAKISYHTAARFIFPFPRSLKFVLFLLNEELIRQQEGSRRGGDGESASGLAPGDRAEQPTFSVVVVGPDGATGTGFRLVAEESA
mmetsp:Transcript_70807/g.224137  ORF Transcript_70807/g.224137 Transcript_70807/m.224137 type:complete len:295 (-) Transcript_70807:60-944(-)